MHDFLRPGNWILLLVLLLVLRGTIRDVRRWLVQGEYDPAVQIGAVLGVVALVGWVYWRWLELVG